MPFLFQKFHNWKYSAQTILLGAALLAYGLFAGQQGFHWDDWGFVWMMRFGGAERLLDYFSVARPVLARMYLVTLPLLGANPLAWQVFALFWRAACAIAMWWALKQIFPKYPREIFWISLLALVYPGFSQHSIAIAYGHYSLLFTAFWLSLGLMIVALRAEKRKWIPLSAALILSAWSLFSAEYAFGLELLRPVFLWFAIANASDTLKTKIIKTLRAYIPYLLILLAFIIWRVFIFGFQMYDAELFDSSATGAPSGLSALPRMIVDALLNASVRAWTGLLDFSAYADFGARLLTLTLIIIIGAFLFLVHYDSHLSLITRHSSLPAPHSARSSQPLLPFTLLGILALLTAGIPFYVAGLPITLNFPNDRFTMSFAFGAASLLVGLINLIRKNEYRAVALSLLVALSIGKQIQFAHAFREDWELQKSFFWQLTWRAPQIEPGTALLSDDSAIRFSTDYSLAGPLNWLYNPGNPNGGVDYAYFFIGTRLHHELPDLKENLPIQSNVRLSSFSGNTSDMLVFQFRTPACLHILDPKYDSDIPAPPNSISVTKDMLADGIPVLTARTLQALPLSDVSRIVTDGTAGAAPPSFLFGTEPPHTWCYYFQKADLARQSGNWEQVAELGDQAFAIPYLPDDASEFLPFIEAYLRLGRMDDARQWTRNASRQMPVIAPALCAVWQRVAADEIAIPESALEKTIRELKYCPSQ
ncbi:MAG: hypothetical protein HFACDABA_00395 [Anaerolineales bacterium]|nr:hypothetical protein [Anaerolineales bacterium]